MFLRVFRTLITGVAACGVAFGAVLLSGAAPRALPSAQGGQRQAPAQKAPAKKKPTVVKWDGPPCDSCRALPELERQLFQQEYLRDRFKDYQDWKTPSPPPDWPRKDSDYMQKYMVSEVLSGFKSHLSSPAGGGGEAVASAELGTDPYSCTKRLYAKDEAGNNITDAKGDEVTEPFVEDDYRKQLACKPLADAFIAHENQHVADCKAAGGGGKLNTNDWQTYAKYDVRGYSTGIASLRKSIAQLATKCGWQGTTKATKDDGQGGQVPTVPTPEQAAELASKEPTVPTPQQIKDLTRIINEAIKK